MFSWNGKEGYLDWTVSSGILFTYLIRDGWDDG